jgi:ABC-type lipoprotein export system ATPase subunit
MSTMTYVTTLNIDYRGDIIIDGINVKNLMQNELTHFRNKHPGVYFSISLFTSKEPRALINPLI